MSWWILVVLGTAPLAGVVVGSGMAHWAWDRLSRPVVVVVCSCGHKYRAHSNGGQCTGTKQIPTRWDGGHPVAVRYVPCGCPAYNGPNPARGVE